MFKTAIQILNWTGKYKNKMCRGFVWSFFVSVFTSVSVIAAAYTVNSILLDLNGVKQLSHNFALWMFLIIALSVAIKFIFVHARTKAQESIGYEASADERLSIGNVLKRVSLGYFEKNKTGDITATITTQLTFLENMGTKMVNMIIGGYTTTAAIMLFLLIFKIEIGLISILGVFISWVVISLLNKGSRKISPIVHKTQEDMTNATIEYLHGMSEVKSYGNENKALDTIKNAFRDNRDINIAVEKKYSPVVALHALALKLAICGIIFFVSLYAIEGEMSLAYSIMMLMFSFTVFSSIEKIDAASHVMGIIDSNINNLNKLKKAEFIDTDGKDIEISNYDIEFSDVSFAYDDVDVIKNVSFKIPQNSTAAIVGPSGGGKSTLCHLIARFYDVQKGSIKVGGHDVRDFTCDSLLKNISMVFQKVYLFHDTIENNILFGNPDATKEQVIEAAKKARCQDFIMSFPDGYDTIIGEGGSTLSGGEKQRISIARAILKDAPIVMLDEATASIDPENEHFIQEALSELTKGKTVITIAHKLTTITNADNIFVLKDGEIHEQGKHNELIQNDGIYKKFIQIRQEAEGWKL